MIERSLEMIFIEDHAYGIDSFVGNKKNLEEYAEKICYAETGMKINFQNSDLNSQVEEVTGSGDWDFTILKYTKFKTQSEFVHQLARTEEFYLGSCAEKYYQLADSVSSEKELKEFRELFLSEELQVLDSQFKEVRSVFMDQFPGVSHPIAELIDFMGLNISLKQSGDKFWSKALNTKTGLCLPFYYEREPNSALLLVECDGAFYSLDYRWG